MSEIYDAAALLDGSPQWKINDESDPTLLPQYIFPPGQGTTYGNQDGIVYSNGVMSKCHPNGSC